MTPAIFGAVESLNMFPTDDPAQALLQSLAAFLIGFFFIAPWLRTGSPWPPIILHWLRDFGTFPLEAAGSGAPAQVTGLAMLAQVPLVLPNALHGLWLLRRV